jgi:hypothetical protein
MRYEVLAVPSWMPRFDSVLPHADGARLTLGVMVMPPCTMVESRPELL